MSHYFVECVSSCFFLEIVFRLPFWGFFGKSQKEFEVRILEIMMKKQSTLKKRFHHLHPLKRHLQQCWRAQNIPRVAWWLVCLYFYVCVHVIHNREGIFHPENSWILSSSLFLLYTRKNSSGFIVHISHDKNRLWLFSYSRKNKILKVFQVFSVSIKVCHLQIFYPTFFFWYTRWTNGE